MSKWKLLVVLSRYMFSTYTLITHHHMGHQNTPYICSKSLGLHEIENLCVLSSKAKWNRCSCWHLRWSSRTGQWTWRRCYGPAPSGRSPTTGGLVIKLRWILPSSFPHSGSAVWTEGASLSLSLSPSLCASAGRDSGRNPVFHLL